MDAQKLCLTFCVILSLITASLIIYEMWLVVHDDGFVGSQLDNLNSISSFYHVVDNPPFVPDGPLHVPIVSNDPHLPLKLELTRVVATGNTITDIGDLSCNSISSVETHLRFMQTRNLEIGPDGPLPYVMPNATDLQAGQCLVTTGNDLALTFSSCAGAVLSAACGTLVTTVTTTASLQPTGSINEFWATAQDSQLSPDIVLDRVNLIRYDSTRVGLGITTPGVYLVQYEIMRPYSASSNNFIGGEFYLATSQTGIIPGTTMTLPRTPPPGAVSQTRSAFLTVPPGAAVDITIRYISTSTTPNAFRWTLMVTGLF